MSLFSTLNTGVSGMGANKTALSTTSHNISNVNSSFYTRQRVNTSATYSSNGGPVNPGLGVEINNIIRLHDEFVYARLKTSSGNLEYSSYLKKNLQEVGQYFPDLKKVGLKQDMENYFNAWNSFASNPDEGSQKINLITNAQTLTSNIQDTRSKIRKLQNSLNEQLKINISEINRLGEQIANINKEIASTETLEPVVANDLRDKRDELELGMSKLINISVFKSGLRSNSTVNTQLTDRGNGYNLNVAGASLVNGINFHPLIFDNTTNPSSYFSIYSERQDEHKTDLTSLINGGKVGALLDLRGREIIQGEKDGYPRDGILQNYIDKLDTFAKSLIVQTNNIYASSASENMISSQQVGLKESTALMKYDRSIQKGSFDIIVYDTAGNEVAKKSIFINETTSMNNQTYGSSILSQLNSNTDDNNDNDSTNDFDDYFKASYSYEGVSGTGNGVLSINRVGGFEGYTISIKDNGTNFSGVIGLKEFFSGNDAKSIKVNEQIVSKPDILSGSASPVSGNNEVANQIIQLQYNNVKFFNKDGTTSSETFEGYYRFITTKIATDAEQANIKHDSNEALHKTIEQQYQSVSGVSLDEELADLMKFQTAYSSNAKVLTTIDKMLDALLGIR